MSKPHRCPHIATTGNICVYCPGGPDSDFEYSTQSYTGYEPTSMRAIRARYNPYVQVRRDHSPSEPRRAGSRRQRFKKWGRSWRVWKELAGRGAAATCREDGCCWSLACVGMYHGHPPWLCMQVTRHDLFRRLELGITQAAAPTWPWMPHSNSHSAVGSSGGGGCCCWCRAAPAVLAADHCVHMAAAASCVV
jgi:hypothetical protein